MKTNLFKTSAVIAVGAFLTLNASAVLIDLGPGSFAPLAPVVTYDTTEFPLGTVNPSITLAAGSLGNVTVSTAGAFSGQSVFAIQPGVYSISGSPTGPLTLNTSVTVSTVNDGASTTSPVLSGSPTFNGPISVLFSQPVAGVGLEGGYFDAVGSTEIEAFDADGNSLGHIFNSVLGFEFYGLADVVEGTPVADISGISFYVNGTEPAGFEIDNLTFGASEQVRPTNSVPDASSTGGLLGIALSGLALLRSRLRK